MQRRCWAQSLTAAQGFKKMVDIRGMQKAMELKPS
jgi:hypothetical protein